MFTNEFQEYKDQVWRVTSRHHQTMDGRDGAPEGLEIMAFSNERYKVNNEWKDNVNKSIVEIFCNADKNIYGVQYHPEDNTTEEFSSNIIKKLLGI